MLLFLATFCSAYSTNRTDYYYDSATGYYVTDNLNGSDITLNGNIASNKSFLKDNGWTTLGWGREISYNISDKPMTVGSIIMINPPDAGVSFGINNASFKGSTGIKLNVSSGSPYTVVFRIRDTLGNQNIVEAIDIEANVWQKRSHRPPRSFYSLRAWCSAFSRA